MTSTTEAPFVTEVFKLTRGPHDNIEITVDQHGDQASIVIVSNYPRRFLGTRRGCEAAFLSPEQADNMAAALIEAANLARQHAAQDA